MFRFLSENLRWLATGFLLAFGSSFGQTYFISLFAGEIRDAYGLTDGDWGLIYTGATLCSALLLLGKGRMGGHGAAVAAGADHRRRVRGGGGSDGAGHSGLDAGAGRVPAEVLRAGDVRPHQVDGDGALVRCHAGPGDGDHEPRLPAGRGAVAGAGAGCGGLDRLAERRGA
jgi:hypothetical protein